MSKASLKGKTTIFGAVTLSIVLIAVSVLAIYGVMPVAAAEIVVDNPSAQYVGTWPVSTGVAGYYGTNYQTHAAGTGANTATWLFNIPTSGNWQVYARWTSSSNRATNAPYTINHADGSTTVTKNQEANGGSWQSLGTFRFNAGVGSVRLTDKANEYVIADAIRLVSVVARARVNVTVTEAEFTPEFSATSLYYDMVIGIENFEGSRVDVHAPLHLPQGATITKAIFYLYDNDVDYFSCYLWRAETGSANGASNYNTPGSNTPGYTNLVIAGSAGLFTIDNNKYRYYLEVEIPYSSVNAYNYRLLYATVEYEVPP